MNSFFPKNEQQARPHKKDENMNYSFVKNTKHTQKPHDKSKLDYKSILAERKK